MILDKNQEIRTCPCPDCYICGAKGVMLYQDLQDRLFSAQGMWNLRKCTNPDCCLVWLDPMPDKEDIKKAYIGYYTHSAEDRRRYPNSCLKTLFRWLKFGYLASAYGYTRGVKRLQLIAGYGFYFTPFLLRSFKKGLRNIHYLPNGKILDVGCGNGAFLSYMRDLYWNVVGIDTDLIAVEQARKHGLTVYYGTLEQQKFSDNQFDVITLCHVLEHVYDPVSLLKECKRILKPGGVIMVYVPNAESFGHHLFGCNWRGLEPPRHLYLFTICALEKLATDVGFYVNVRTSSSGARSIYKQSTLLNAWKYKDSMPKDWRLINAYVFDLIESIGIFFGKKWGEEIVLQGIKPKL